MLAPRNKIFRADGTSPVSGMRYRSPRGEKDRAIARWSGVRGIGRCSFTEQYGAL